MKDKGKTKKFIPEKEMKGPDVVYNATEKQAEYSPEIGYKQYLERMFAKCTFIMVKLIIGSGEHIQFWGLDNSKAPIKENGSPLIFSSLELYNFAYKAFEKEADLLKADKQDVVFIISAQGVVQSYIKGLEKGLAKPIALWFE
jgi:hypothetical protein